MAVCFTWVSQVLKYLRIYYCSFKYKNYSWTFLVSARFPTYWSHWCSLSHDLHFWMSSNQLSPNSNKMQFIWFGPPQQLLKLDISLLTERYPSFVSHSSDQNLCIVLDSILTFSEHVANLTHSSYFQWRTEHKCRPGRWPQMPPFQEKKISLAEKMSTKTQKFLTTLFVVIHPKNEKLLCPPFGLCCPKFSALLPVFTEKSTFFNGNLTIFT